MSWWRLLSHVSNICAHHGRIYNKCLSLTPELPRDDKTRMPNARIFATIFVAGILTPFDEEWETFKINLESMIDQYSEVLELYRIGFPEHWRNILRDQVYTRRYQADLTKIRIREQHQFFWLA